ncbi:MAG: hypothetical protein GY774_39980 [Planctomycetes bacterium]|nr:hypothetical protein [Planctomycetota bacterium]
MEAITWITQKVRLGDLVEWEPNPRHSTKEQAARIALSINKFGYSQLIEVESLGDGKYRLIDGHQRKPVMEALDKYGPDAMIEARVSSRKFTVEERKEYIALKHKGAQGEEDKDKMLNLYDGPDLLEWGYSEWEVKSLGFDIFVDGFDFGNLPKEDRAPFQQMTFTLHDTQAEQVKEALKASKGMGEFDSQNENSNGNALSRICETFINDIG